MSERTTELFGTGPWDGEGDAESFEYLGLSCRLLRSTLGFWCGYVGVPKGHPWYGRRREQMRHVRVHGSVTFAETSPELGPDLWWVGFDCGHSDDQIPAYGAMFPLPIDPNAQYRTKAFAMAQTTLLAAQAEAALRLEQPLN